MSACKAADSELQWERLPFVLEAKTFIASKQDMWQIEMNRCFSTFSG